MKNNHWVYEQAKKDADRVIKGLTSEDKLIQALKDLQFSNDDDIVTAAELALIYYHNKKIYQKEFDIKPLNVSYWKAMKVITQEEWNELKKISYYDMRGGGI